MTMPKLNVNGINLYYELHGKGHPLVLIAGFTCDTLLWKPILPELQKHFKVLIFDNRGAGQSDCPDISYSIEMMAQDTLELVERLDLKRPHVLGHSMGGCIAQMLAYHHPNRFERFAICNSLIKFNPVSSYYQTFLLHLRQEGVSPRLLLEAIFPWIFSSDFLQNHQKVQQAIEESLSNPHPQSLIGFKRQLEALISFDSSLWFHQIGAPTLIINGMEDILCPHDSEKLAKGIVGAKLINFPRMGHLPLIEEPEEFSNFIIHFFKMQESILSSRH
jgi:3-oxoadipate enol-lactonase